jgi:O-antigen ligase
VITLPMWTSSHRRWGWSWVGVAGGLIATAVVLAWTRLDELRDGFSALLVLEGAGGNTRWDMWTGTWDLFMRSPLVGCGLGSYRHVIGLDKPATGTAVLEHAHNDWLEWLATSGVVGGIALVLALVAIVAALWPPRIRTYRFEIRYPLAGAAAACVTTALHELIGFGLQTPLNRYLLAVWVGLIWGVANRVTAARERAAVQNSSSTGSGSGSERERDEH